MTDDRYEVGRLSFALRRATGAPGDRDEALGLGARRDGVLYVPETAGPAAPLLVFLHGAAGTGRAHLRAVLGAVDRYGVALVAPDSRGPTWDIIVERRFGPDVAFLDRVLDAVVGRVDVDTRRLAIGGVSDGASYALSIGLTNGDVLPAVLAFSPGFLVAPDPTGRPRIFISHGRSDPILPIDACSRSFVPELRGAGYEVNFREFDGGHTVPPPIADEAVGWWLDGAPSSAGPARRPLT
jgi:phospholipase/carboxylesterase